MIFGSLKEENERNLSNKDYIFFFPPKYIKKKSKEKNKEVQENKPKFVILKWMARHKDILKWENVMRWMENQFVILII